MATHRLTATKKDEQCMRVYGLDFTSAPRTSKPLTCAVAELDGHTLRVSAVERLETFAAFEAWLAQLGPWIAALDFPFGQPEQLLRNLGWSQTWAEYVVQFAALGDMAVFEVLLRQYRDGRAPGDKEHYRLCDRRARSRSPMKVANPPVGKMFWQGAPRLLRSGANIVPCRPNDDDRIVLEGYPALVVRWALAQAGWTDKPKYKSDTRREQTPALEKVRHVIAQMIESDTLLTSYGIHLAMGRNLTETCIRDATGDTLDAVLCATQAAWAWTQRTRGYGIAPAADPNEGWIVDPALLV